MMNFVPIFDIVNYIPNVKRERFTIFLYRNKYRLFKSIEMEIEMLWNSSNGLMNNWWIIVSFE